ncbi:MAG: hypothetical protein ACXWQE_14705, partial [Bdellovibrionales bacterium]
MSSKNSFASAQAIAVITTLSLSLVNCSKLTSSHPESASTSPAQGNDTAPASPVTTSPVIPPVIAPPVVTAPIVPAPLKLSAGTYKSVVSLCTSFQPFCLESLVITGSTFQATYNFILASDGEDKVLVVATGTYTLSTGEVTLTQQSLLLTSPAAVLGNVNCPGLVVTAGVPVDVAGKTCNSTNMWNNGGTDGTKFFQVNDGTLNERISGIVNFGDPKIYHLDSSLMLQTPLAAFDPGPATLTAGNYVSAFTRYTFPGVVANSNPAYNARLDSIDILGNAYTVHATL